MTNIALVVLDTLRKDRFDDYFEWLPGLRFENAYSTANWTVPAHASLFTGKYSTEVGLHAHSRTIEHPEETISHSLSEVGYNTRGYSSNHHLSERDCWDECFDEFQGPFDLWYPSAENIFNWNNFLSETDNTGIQRYIEGILQCIKGDCNTVQSLKQGFYMQRGSLYKDSEVDDKGASVILQKICNQEFSNNEFIFINLMEAHTPYYPPKEYRAVDDDITVTVKHSLDLESPPEGVIDAYDSSVEYLSEKYKEMFYELREEFDYIITVSDHGEMLGENGVWNHTFGLYPELTHIPIVISGEELSGTVTKPVSLIDVHKTIASLADVSVESRGQDLLGEIKPKSYLTEYQGLIPFAVSKLEEGGVSTKTIEQYQEPLRGVVLDNGAYGHEDINGFVPSENNAKFQNAIDSIQSSLEKRKVSGGQRELSEETKNHLEDLGYA